ncbi:MAG: hypothetical protein IJ740_08375 [Ruminococcus sp.]|nr:hypothetical protein [Ruminococcus sp.]
MSSGNGDVPGCAIPLMLSVIAIAVFGIVFVISEPGKNTISRIIQGGNISSQADVSSTIETTPNQIEYYSSQKETYITVVLPPSIVGDDPEKYAESMSDIPDKIVSATAKSNGSVELVCTQKGYEIVCEAVHDSAVSILDTIVPGSENYPNFASFKYNDDLTDFELRVIDVDTYRTHINNYAYLFGLKLAVEMYHTTLKTGANPILHLCDKDGIEFETVYINDLFNADSLENGSESAVSP